MDGRGFSKRWSEFLKIFPRVPILFFFGRGGFAQAFRNGFFWLGFLGFSWFSCGFSGVSYGFSKVFLGYSSRVDDLWVKSCLLNIQTKPVYWAQATKKRLG